MSHRSAGDLLTVRIGSHRFGRRLGEGSDGPLRNPAVRTGRVMRSTPPSADVAVIGGSGFYSMFDEAEDIVVDTPYGAPSAPLRIGEVAGRRVAFLPRHGVRSSVPAAPHPLPRECLGAARPRRPADPGALRRWLPDLRCWPRRDRGSRPAARPHRRTGGHIPRRPHSGARQLRRPVLSCGPRRRARHRRSAWAGRRRRRHAGRGGGAAVQHPGRIPVLRCERLQLDQHDRVTGSGAGPRACRLLHRHRPGHRFRRGCGCGDCGHPGRGLPCLRGQPGAAA